jgi:iron complex transport system substrate-binding protein
VPTPRILPLIASATEIVHALGLGPFQVGRSHECDHPPEVLGLPVCTRPAFRVDGSSAEIDRRVKERLAAAVNIYDVDVDLVARLKPSHIITQTQCKVCAVSLDDVERALRSEIRTEARIISCEPYSLDDIFADIQRIANGCGVPQAGAGLIAALRTRLNHTSDLAAKAGNRPRVAAIEWLEPLMSAGNWVPELVELAQAQNLFGEPGKHSPWMTWQELAAADPDILVILPCGFDIARTDQEMHWLTDRPDWERLRAVGNQQVFLCDGNQFFNRPGPRIAESLEILAEILHPDLFQAKAEQGRWVRFSSTV